jgi:transcriptional regulator with XRE-family HTH domain
MLRMASAPGELGVFLRARRARVRPEDVGLPAGVGIRRTPGLRREELAALAGVSIEYLTRLEQGKETNPSTGVLDALARALLLDGDAHAHLYALANHAAHRAPPPRKPADRRSGRAVRPSVEQLLERLRPSPAYVLNPISDILAANPEAVTLFVGLDAWPRSRWNTIRHLFLHPAARDLFVDWQEVATIATANLRGAVAGQTPHSAEASTLIEELTASSQEFVRLWERYDVHPRRSRHKTFHHPAVGRLTLHQEVLNLSDGLRLSVYQAEPNSRDDTALTLLALGVRDPVQQHAPHHGDSSTEDVESLGDSRPDAT